MSSAPTGSPPPDSVTLRLTLGSLKVAHTIATPARPVAAREALPAFQGLVNATVAAAERASVAAGGAISCRKGCGACCRQLVPISATEGERLLDLVAALPAERRAVVEQRFAEARAKLDQAGLVPALLDPAARAGRSDNDLSAAYFRLGLGCPFLDEESCSIHLDRPLVCREYLVTSPAALCAGPAQEGVTPVAVPKLSMAARGLESPDPAPDAAGRWFALALLPAFAQRRPTAGPAMPTLDWIKRFVSRLGRRP